METNIQAIDNAKCAGAAVSMTDHRSRRDYIIAKRDRRALGGNFKATRANVAEKFMSVWEAENGK